jgi:hypothetical protein
MFIYEIRDRLVAQGVGTYGTNIFIGAKAVIPTGEGPYLSLIDTGGSGSAKTQTDTATERPSLQMVTRAATTAAARSMLIAAYLALGGPNGLYNVTLGGVFYVSITARQSVPTDIGTDASGRAMLSMNFDAEKQPSEAYVPWVDLGWIQ